MKKLSEQPSKANRTIDRATYYRAAKLFRIARRAHKTFLDSQNQLILEVLGLEDPKQGDHVYGAIIQGQEDFDAALAKEGVSVKPSN